MMKILQETSTPETARSSNAWDYKGQTYFYQIGRENADGAITGTVFRNLPDGEHCRRAGRVRIEPDGTISAWTGSTAAQRARAQQMGAAEFNRIHSRPLVTVC
jgi:glucose/arabinose dehydrogenase